jgi:hypothetical protein
VLSEFFASFEEFLGEVNGFLQDLTLTLDLVVVDEPD